MNTRSVFRFGQCTCNKFRTVSSASALPSPNSSEVRCVSLGAQSNSASASMSTLADSESASRRGAWCVILLPIARTIFLVSSLECRCLPRTSCVKWNSSSLSEKKVFSILPRNLSSSIKDSRSRRSKARRYREYGNVVCPHVDRTILLHNIDHLCVVNSCSANDSPSLPPLMGDRWLILLSVRERL